MTSVGQLAERLCMKVMSGQNASDKQVDGVYTCDMLSRVISRAGKNSAWITVHTNLNIVAVAILAEISCIIIPDGITVDGLTLKKADKEGVAILATDMDAYTVCWKAHGILSNTDDKAKGGSYGNGC